MALAGAGPALAGHSPGHPTKSQGQGPKLVTGNPPKTTVIHCKRAVPGSRGVIIIKVRKGVVSVKNNCRGVPAGVPVLLPVRVYPLVVLNSGRQEFDREARQA